MDISAQIKDVLSQYDLGDLITYEKNERGFVNKSFAIDVNKSGIGHRYFLRQYKRGVKPEELAFEHSLINHLVAKKYPPVAQVYRTRNGKTYVESPAEEAGGEPIFYAIFDYLNGEDRYSWVNPNCNEVEVKRSAEILAQFHSALSDFVPAGQRAEPGIMALLTTIPQIASQCQVQSKHTIFDTYLSENLPLIEAEVAQILSLFTSASQEMPMVIIHCDYHPGNLKFDGEEVVGLFDFDWSKIDYRCFDFGLAAFYIFTEWEGVSDGRLRLGPFGVFLNAYQKECAKYQRIPPLTQEELKHLPAMIRAGNLYILNWTILDYYGKEVNPEEYHQYLKHGIETIKGSAIETNARLLKNVIEQFS